MPCMHKLLCTVRSYETDDSAGFLGTTFEDNSLHDAGTVPQNKCAQKLVYKRLRHRNAREVNNNLPPSSQRLLNLQTYGERR